MKLEEFIEVVIHTEREEIEMIDIDFNPNMDLDIINSILFSNLSKLRKTQAIEAIISSLNDFNYFYCPFSLMLPDSLVEWLIQNEIALISLTHLYLKPKYLEQIIQIIGPCLEAEEKLKQYNIADKKLNDLKKKNKEFWKI